MSANTPPRDDATFVLEYNGAKLAEADSKEELVERGRELEGKALLFFEGDFAQAFDSAEDAKDFASQRSYDLRMSSFWSIVVDGEVVFGHPPGDHPHDDEVNAAVLVEVDGNVHAFFVDDGSFVQIAVADGPLEEDWLQRALAYPQSEGVEG